MTLRQSLHDLMYYQPRCIPDLLLELTLREKFALLGRIYWRKLTDNRLVRAVRIFCGAVYEWLFTGKNVEEVECELAYPKAQWVYELNDAVGETWNVVKDGYCTQNEIDHWYKEDVINGDPNPRSFAQTLLNRGKGWTRPKMLSEVHVVNEKDPITPTDYGLTTTLYDGKNLPQERDEWNKAVMEKFSGRIPQNLCDQTDLDYWFSADYTPDAVVQMLQGRRRRENSFRTGATYYTGNVPASSYYSFRVDEQYIKGWK